VYRTSIDFHKRITRGEKPVPYIVISTALGYRAYAQKELNRVFEVEGYFADGTYTADGSITAGSGLGVLEKSARVIDFGLFERSIQPKKEVLLLA